MLKFIAGLLDSEEVEQVDAFVFEFRLVTIRQMLGTYTPGTTFQVATVDLDQGLLSLGVTEHATHLTIPFQATVEGRTWRPDLHF